MPKKVADVCPHHSRGVPADHLCDAVGVIVGEAPGSTENRIGLPFVGQAGHLLDSLLEAAGLSRSQFYITNVYPFQPPNNDLSRISPQELESAIGELRRKLSRLAKSANVIVPLGNTALRAVVGHPGIMKWRGSVLRSEFGKVIPIIHPAAALRQPMLAKTMAFDWQKVARELTIPGVRVPRIFLLPVRDNDDRLRELLTAKALAVDIETIKNTPTILCVAFCASKKVAFSVDCRKGIPDIVRQLLESDIPKIMHNGAFDAYVLARNGVSVKNFLFDTSLMFHALDNNVGPQTVSSEGKSILKPYSLAYEASVFTPFPYWKESAKDAGTGESYGAWRTNWRRFQEYNAMDALGTYWVAHELRKRLMATDKWDFYRSQYADLIAPQLELSLHGIRFDAAGAKKRSEELVAELQTLKRNLAKAAGQPLHAIKVYKHPPKVTENRPDGMEILAPEAAKSIYGIEAWVGEKKSISANILKEFLYEKCNLRAQRKENGRITVDEVAIQKLLLAVEAAKWPPDKKAHLSGILKGVLRFREIEKTIQFLATDNCDPDGRLRAAYSITQTGRLRSAKNPIGTGTNLQNIQRDVRHFFLPDHDDWFLLEIDLKQAEDLVVKAMSGHPKAMELVAAVWDGSIDIHRRMASYIFQKPPEAITADERQTAKKARHARNNGMHAKRLSETLLKEMGVAKSIAECARILEATDRADPWVADVHKAIRRAIMRHRSLATSWGWQLDFTHERLTDPAVFRRGYAFIQQSEVGVLMRQWGLLHMWQWLRTHNKKSRINLLVHDNLVLSCPREELYDVMEELYRSLTRTRLYKVRAFPGDDEGATPMAIPADITIGKTLKCTCGKCKKPLSFGQLPDRDTFFAELEKWEKDKSG
jgi:uracil-DNA glycosylase family 4